LARGTFTGRAGSGRRDALPTLDRLSGADLRQRNGDEKPSRDATPVLSSLGGLVILAGGVAGLVETENHQPAYLCNGTVDACERGHAALTPDPATLGEPIYQLLEAASGLVIVIGVAVLLWGFVLVWRRGRAA
jgi:hypothetical protein